MTKYSLSQKGETLLNGFEGFRSHPYLDVKGVSTIGYGTTHYPSGRKVAIGDAPISQETAVTYRDFFINQYIFPVIEKEVIVPLNQNQVDALVSFIYNVGPGAFETSHLLQKINTSAPCDEIKVEFAKWKKSGGRIIPDLVTRRSKEALLFCS